MARVVNAKSISGSSLSFVVKGGRFRAVSHEPTPAAPDPHSGALTLASSLGDLSALPEATVIDAQGATLVPGGVDVHVHSRDPGLTHKEDWSSLSAGAWRGGVVAVADMPNTVPPTMTRAAVLAKAELARASGLGFGLQLGVGASNIGQVAQLLADPELPLCALKVFYGRTTGELLYDDLETLARSLPEHGDKPIVFHSEDQCTIDCNHAQLSAQTAAQDKAGFAVHSAIRSSAAAHASTRTILAWARTSYKRRIHIAHVSTPLEVELVLAAKASGVPVTCEVAPHHLLFSTDDYARLGPLVKMNPPLRSPAERDALAKLFGLGQIDIYATDHAPHLLQEKFTDVAHSPSGVPGVELFYQLLFALADSTGLSRERAVAMAAATPAALFGFKSKGQIADGFDADFAWIGGGVRRIRGEEVVAKCGWTPYEGYSVPCDVLGTWSLGRQVFRKHEARQTNA